MGGLRFWPIFLSASLLAVYGFDPDTDPDSISGLPRKTKTKFTPVAEEARYLKCDVCQKSLRHLYHSVEDARASKKRKLGEDELLTMVEETCLPLTEQGEWIVRTDLVQESEGTLKVVDMASLSRCKTECETVARACHDTLGDVDTDVAELLYHRELKLSKLINKVCWEMTDACKKRSLTKPHKEEERQEMSEKERNMFLMVEEMNAKNPMGQKMSLYSREDLQESLGDRLPGGEPDEFDEDDYTPKPARHHEEKPVPDASPDGWVEWTVFKAREAINWVSGLFYDPSEGSDDEL